MYLVNISPKNNQVYVKKMFEVAFNLIKNGITDKIINGPINKTKTLKEVSGRNRIYRHSFNQKNLLC